MWVSPSFPAFRCRDLPHACSEDAPRTEGQDREGEPGPEVLHISGSTRWYNPAEARPDEGKQHNKETEICDCVKNMMALCPLLYSPQVTEGPREWFLREHPRHWNLNIDLGL